MSHFPMWTAVNFAILLIVLVSVLKKPLKSTVDQKHDMLKKEIEETEALKIKTQKLLSEIESKMKNIDQELAQIMKEAGLQAQAEKEKILLRANQTAQNIMDQAGVMAQFEMDKAKKRLQAQIMKEAIEMAKRELSGKISDQSQQQFLKDFIKSVESAHV